MQTQLNRVSQKSYTSGELSLETIRAEATEQVQKWMIVHQDWNAPRVADVVIRRATDGTDPDFYLALTQLADLLVRKFYVRLIQAERRKAAAARHAASTPPELLHLPATIKLGDRKIRLLDANFARVRDYYWSLMAHYTERKRKDRRIQAAKSLMDEMRKRTRRDKGITVREVVSPSLDLVQS